MEQGIGVISLAVDFIILIGALCLAITRIYEFFAKPTSKIKKQRDQELRDKIVKTMKEELPKILEEHDLETRNRYLSDRMRYLNEIKDSVLEDISDTINIVRTDNCEQNDMLKVLVQTSKDILRQRIMDIYHKYKGERKMPIYAREALDELYKDYKSEGGNSYIDKYYKRMSTWEVYEDDDGYID